MIKDHHEGYINWAEYERNQKQLAINAYGTSGGTGMLTCGRCGCRLSVTYTGNPQSRPVYRCDKPNLMMGQFLPPVEHSRVRMPYFFATPETDAPSRQLPWGPALLRDHGGGNQAACFALEKQAARIAVPA